MLCSTLLNLGYASSADATLKLIDEQLEAGRKLFYQAIAAEDQIEPAERLFLSLRAQLPNPQVVDAFVSALTLLRAKHSLWPSRKLRLANEGLEGLDRLLELHPNDFEIRFLRATNGLALPFFFGRREQAEADVRQLFEALPAQAEKFPVDRLVGMAEFLIDSGVLNDTETTQLQELQRRWQLSETP